MLPGYNHNVTYKGQTFHIQTEDSGVKNPHIITLLYVKGNIIARKKKEYSDILKFERLEDVVRELMQDQHKEMLRDLKNGRYDDYLGIKRPEAARPAAPQPAAAGPAMPKAPAAPAATAAPPPPHAPIVEPEVKEKPAQKTLELREDEDLKDEDIFGADIISNKSLDEVILSYLAQDIDDE